MSILTEAENIINGDRRVAYGDPLLMGDNIARGWRVIFKSHNITAEQVNLAMIWLKICRELNNHQMDNLVDVAGYAGVIEKIKNSREGTK